MKAAADGFVDTAQARFVIAGDDEFELRPILEKVLAHEARRDGIAAGELS